MMRVRFVAPARFEFLAAVERLEREAPGAGRRLGHAVEAALRRAVAFPDAGSPVPSGVRRVFVAGFPYSVFYISDARRLVVLAVAHHARHPGYWAARVQEPIAAPLAIG